MAERVLAHAARTKVQASMLMIDIDHFKAINDRHGHLSGDEVLKAMAATVQTCLRKEDLLMRYGGEEFCVLLPATGSDGALVLAERIRADVARQPVRVKDDDISITISIGVATLGQAAGPDLGVLFAGSDKALYAAKNAGRNRVECATG